MKKKHFNKSVLLLIAAAVLLLASTVGSTQAALTYYSENYSAEVTVANIGVTLLENDSEVGSRNYVLVDRASETYGWDEVSGNLLSNMLAEGEKLVLGQKYEERISVKNSGEIDSYVRVILTKSWQDADGKDTELSPALIKVDTLTNNGWILDESASSQERIVLYYTKVLASGAETPDCTEAIGISSEIAKYVDKQVSEDGKTVTYDYTYNGYTFNLDAEVDAVQTHNATDAMKSAWGVDVEVDAEDGSISLK